MFKDKSKADGLDTMARSKLRLSLDSMRVNANNCALNQFQSREAINCQQLVSLLIESYSPSQGQSALLIGLQQTSTGPQPPLGVHTLSPFSW